MTMKLKWPTISEMSLRTHQAFNVVGIVINLGFGIFLPNWLSPLNFFAAGLLTGTFALNIHLARYRARHEELFAISQAQNEMIQRILEIKSAEIGAQIAAHIDGSDDAPRITKH